jgi:preprotein translocase subunit SecB
MDEAAKESNGNGSTPGTGQFSLQKIYIKDLSFEAPNTPDVFTDSDTELAEPQIQLNLKNSHASLTDNNIEVVLHASLHATLKERTLFMVEIDQAGIFLIKGYADKERQALIGTYCPSALFPYLREAISGVIGKGGFPAILLQPINFDALFAQAMQEQAAQNSDGSSASAH